MPGSGIEILCGKVLKVPGADPPHATHHARLAYVLSAHVSPGFVAAVDMLTRTSADSDFAPDASVSQVRVQVSVVEPDKTVASGPRTS